MFSAQVQLSRSLQAGRRGREVHPGGGRRGREVHPGGGHRDNLSDYLPTEDSAGTGHHTNTQPDSTEHPDTACRVTVSTIEQQMEDDVRGLPDVVVTDKPSSDIIKRLREKKQREHRETVGDLHQDLAVFSKDYEVRYRQTSSDLLSFLGDRDHRLDTMMERTKLTDQHSIQELHAVWEEVREELLLRRRRIREMDQVLTGYETERSGLISILLRRYCSVLERVSFLHPSDVIRLIDTEAMVINQALLANRRSVARLFLHLLEKELQKEALLHLRWEDQFNAWKRSRVNQVIDRVRELVSSESVQKPGLVQEIVQELRRTQQTLSEQRCHHIQQVCSMVPPTCSTALVSDWYNQLTAVNQKIDCLHVDFMRQVRCSYEQTWQRCLAEVERSKEELLCLELSEEEVKHIISSKLLTLIGQSQSRAEERLATLDCVFESLSSSAGLLCRSVCGVLCEVVLLWETHSQTLQTREQQLQEHLDHLRHTQEEEVQKKEAHLDMLLDRLRQESTEDALKSSLDKTLVHLHDIKDCWTQWYSGVCEALDSFPGSVLEELHSYSAMLSHCYHGNTYTLSPEELHNLYPSINLDLSEPAGINKQYYFYKKRSISSQKNDGEPTLASQDRLVAESFLADLCDFGRTVTFTSCRGRAYSGPAFVVPAPDPLDGLEDETQHTLFPVEPLTQSLSRMRVMFFDHLEQHFHEVLSSTVAMVAGRKEALHSEHALFLQLHERRPQRIQTDIHDTRAAELLVHRQCVEVHCEEVLQVLSSCRSEIMNLQTLLQQSNQMFTSSLCSMEELLLHTTTHDRLESLRSTLQARLDQHIKETQCSQRASRQSVHQRLETLRDRNTSLISSFRLFSEGGNFSPQEVEVLLRRLEKVTKALDVKEESVQSHMEAVESRSLEQVRGLVTVLEEKFSCLSVELKFLEKIQNVLTKTQVYLKTQAACSNQQQVLISSRVEELRRQMKEKQVCEEEVFSVLTCLSEELQTRSRYLDCFLECPAPQRPLQGSFSLAARLQSRLAPPPGSLLQPCRMGVAFSDDTVVDLVKDLNKLRIQDVAAEEAGSDLGETAAPSGFPPTESLRRKSTESVSGQSVKKVPRPSRNDKRLHVFLPEPEKNPTSFKSIVNHVLWEANDMLLLVAEDFYRTTARHVVSKFLFLPDRFDRCVESLNKRLLGYQEQTKYFTSTSIQEFGKALCVLEELLCLLPGVLFGNQGRQWEAELLEEVGRVRRRIKQTLRASEDRKSVHVSQLRVRLASPACEEELSALRKRELERQEQLCSTIHMTFKELQEFARVKEEEFVTSLSTLTEGLLLQMDNLLRGHDSTSSESMETTAVTDSVTTTKSLQAHLAVIEQRDTTLKRYAEVSRSELLRCEEDRDRQLAELQRWSQHWNTHTHTH